MMARMPDRLACHSLLFAVAVGMSVAAAGVSADGDPTPATAQPDNSRGVAETAGKSTRSTVRSPLSTAQNRPTYRDPFGDSAKAPPIEGATPAGSVNQWRRPAIPRWAAPASQPQAEPLTQQASPPQPHPLDPSLVTELTKSEQLIRTTPKANPQPRRATLVQPESISNGPLVATPTSSRSPTTVAVAAAAENDIATAAIAADAAGTPEACLALAAEAAARATEAEDLTNVIGLCERGLRGQPSAKQLASLRRLAAWAHNRRGELLADAQRLDDAQRDFQAAIALDSVCSLAIHNRGVTFAQQNQFAAALRDFNRVIELNPGLAVAYRNRAELHSALDHMPEAVADYDRAVAALPDDVELRLARAHAQQRLGNFAQAANDIAHVLKLVPNDARALAQRGNLAADQGKFADAERDLRRAIEANPDSPEAYRSLAWLLATCPDKSRRDGNAALALAKRAAELAPADYQVLDTLAAAEANVGNFDHAVELQQAALAAVPRSLSSPLAERLALYQQHRPYAPSAPRRAVQPASHEASAPPMPTRATKAPAKRTGRAQ